MRITRFLILLTLFNILMGIYAENFPKLFLYTEDWEPFHYIGESNMVEGYVVDLVDMILKDIDNSQTKADIELIPWARGYKLTQLKKNAIIFSTTRTQEREHLFKWVGPIFNNRMYLVAKKDRNIVISGDEELKQYKTGTVKDDVGNILLEKRGINEEFIHESGTSQDSVRLLTKNRVDMIATTWLSFINICKVLEIDYTHYEQVYTLSDLSLYFAFNPYTEDWVIKQFKDSFYKVQREIPELLD